MGYGVDFKEVIIIYVNLAIFKTEYSFSFRIRIDF